MPDAVRRAGLPILYALSRTQCNFAIKFVLLKSKGQLLPTNRVLASPLLLVYEHYEDWRACHVKLVKSRRCTLGADKILVGTRYTASSDLGHGTW